MAKFIMVYCLVLSFGCSEQQEQEQPYYRAVMLANQIGDTLYLVEERDPRYSSVVVWEYVAEFKSFKEAEAYALERNTAKIKERLDAEARRLRRIR